MGFLVSTLGLRNTIRTKKTDMKIPTYNPIRMGDPVFANEYGKKMLRYRKSLEKKQIEENRNNENQK